MAKRLVVCCDGTWNTADQQDATNVTKFALAVAASDAAGVEQRVFYDAGVGSSRADRFRGGIFGVGLSENVQDAYRFIVETYTPGDELFFVGFSRGAFTARSTVGLIRNAGILRPAHAGLVGDAYKLYRSKAKTTEPGQREAILFRRSYSYETSIKFIGVWDTVGALGIPATGLRSVKLINSRWEFHDTKLSGTVDNAYHALAIDEARRPFAPALWEHRPDAPEDQHVEQVWFSGVHSNVGGGYPDTSLADIPLLWMVDKARSHGLTFDEDGFDGPPKVTVAPDPLGSLEDSRRLFYRLSKPAPRSIGDPRYVPQSVASTAVRRREKDPRYAPPRLVDYLSGPNPRITDV